MYGFIEERDSGLTVIGVIGSPFVEVNLIDATTGVRFVVSVVGEGGMDDIRSSAGGSPGTVDIERHGAIGEALRCFAVRSRAGR